MPEKINNPEGAPASPARREALQKIAKALGLGAVASTGVISIIGSGGGGGGGEGGGENPEKPRAERFNWDCKADSQSDRHYPMRANANGGVVPRDMAGYVLNCNLPLEEGSANLRGGGVVIRELVGFIPKGDGTGKEIYFWKHPAGKAGIEKMNREQYRNSNSGIHNHPQAKANCNAG